MSHPYQTKRLKLHPMSAKFKTELDELHAENDVMASVGGAYSPAISLKKMQESEEHWLTYGFGLWCWFLKDTSEFVGRGGLRWQQLDNGQRIIEIAYMVHKQFWGQGLATEVAQYCLDVGFNHFKFQEIVALTTPANTRSQKVIKKLALTFDAEPVSFRSMPNLISRTHFK